MNTLIREPWFRLKKTVLVYSLITLLALHTHILQAQSNELLVYEQRVLWVYVANASFSQRPLNAFRVSYSFSTIDAEFSIHSSTWTNATININVVVNFIGRERLRYMVTSIIEENFNTTMEESIEGNMAIDVKNIIIQWHKYEVVLPGEYNTSVKADFINLNKIINNRSFNIGNVIENGNGVRTLVTQSNKLTYVVSLIDVYLNKTGYMAYYLKNAQECDILDYLPMKTDIKFNANISKDVMRYHMYINGLEAEDPLNSYRAMLCLLPSLTLVQNIVKRVEANLTTVTSIPRISDYVLESIVPWFLDTFAVNILSGYSETSLQGAYSNAVFVSLFNTTDTSYVIELGIHNVNITYSTEYYKNWLCNISKYMVRPYLGKDLCSEIKKATIYTYTQSPAQPQQPNKLSNTFTLLLVVIIVIVSVETALVVYMALKVLRYRRASG